MQTCPFRAHRNLLCQTQRTCARNPRTHNSTRGSLWVSHRLMSSSRPLSCQRLVLGSEATAGVAVAAATLGAAMALASARAAATEAAAGAAAAEFSVCGHVRGGGRRYRKGQEGGEPGYHGG